MQQGFANVTRVRRYCGFGATHDTQRRIKIKGQRIGNPIKSHETEVVKAQHKTAIYTQYMSARGKANVVCAWRSLLRVIFILVIRLNSQILFLICYTIGTAVPKY